MNTLDRQRCEDSLKTVSETAKELLQIETEAEIANAVVGIATKLLDTSGSTIYFYDDRVGELVLASHSGIFDTAQDEPPRYLPKDSASWQIFSAQDSEHFEDIRTADDIYNSGAPVRSQLLLPLGDHGVFIISDNDLNSFDDFAVEVAELIATTTEAALDRANRTQKLRRRERESLMQAQRLERVHQLNDEIRTITQSLVDARSREAIKQQVCDSIVSLDQFEYAWIGEPNPTTNEVIINNQVGSPSRYLEMIDLDLDTDNTQPAVRATRTRSTVNESDIAAKSNREEWRNTALLYDFRSVISVPLLHDDVLYGVLTIYSSKPDNFGDLTTPVLTELGELIAYALNTVDQRRTLLGSGASDVVFELTDGDDVFVDLAAHLSGELQVKTIIPRSEKSYLVHLLFDSADPEEMLSIPEKITAIEDVRSLSEPDSDLYEIILIGDCIATTLADLGADLRTVTVSESYYRLEVLIPEDRNPQTCIRYLKNKYPDIDPIARQHNTSDSSLSKTQLLYETLTDRQRDILEAAYYNGFFDQRRKRTGSEIADSLDISQPAFSKQLRAAQLNLMNSILEDRSNE